MAMGVAAQADAQDAFLDGGDSVAGEMVSGDHALSAATEVDGVWNLSAGDADVGLLLDAAAPTEAWDDDGLAGWERAGVAEWITTARNGIEHAILVDEPLAAGNEQRLTVLTVGLQPAIVDPSNVVLIDAFGLPKIAYGGLFAFDADAHDVPVYRFRR